MGAGCVEEGIGSQERGERRDSVSKAINSNRKFADRKKKESKSRYRLFDGGGGRKRRRKKGGSKTHLLAPKTRRG